jgi:hypothetical protein
MSLAATTIAGMLVIFLGLAVLDGRIVAMVRGRRRLLTDS